MRERETSLHLDLGPPLRALTKTSEKEMGPSTGKPRRNDTTAWTTPPGVKKINQINQEGQENIYESSSARREEY